MKVLFFLCFLSIFSTACLEKEPVDLVGDGFNQLSGLVVAQDPYCQRLQIADPPEVGKHQLPIQLQSFRDYCQKLHFTRSVDFLSTSAIFRCRIDGATLGTPEFQSFLADLAGEDLTLDLQDQGDIDRDETGQVLFFGEDSTDNTMLAWTMDQLWDQLSPQVPDLESLSWRLGFQHTNSGVCSSRAKWEVRSDLMFLHNLEKCYSDGQAYTETYTFLPNGQLQNLAQTPLAESLQCLNPSFRE